MIGKIGKAILAFIFIILAGRARSASEDKVIRWLESHNASVMCEPNGHTTIFLHGKYEGCEMLSGNSFRDVFSDAVMRAAAQDAAGRAKDAA